MSESYVDFPVFGEDSTKEKPGDPKYNLGFNPGDVLPAEWLNWFLNVMSAGYNQLKSSAENFTPASPNTFTNKTISYDDNTMPGVQPTITGGASTITTTDLTASKVLVSDANGKVSASSVPSSAIRTGTVHNATFATGFTGSGQWCVNNGICVLRYTIKSGSAPKTGATVLTGLPKCKMHVALPTSDRANGLYVNPGDTKLYGNFNNADENYGEIVYPVSDDWVES